MINTKICQLEENIINLINESQVPPVVVTYMLERIQKEANIAATQVLKMEQEAIQKQQEQQQQVAQETYSPATPNGEPITEIVQNENELIDVDLNK